MDDPRTVYAEAATRSLALAGRTPRRPIEFRSQAGEDAFLWDLFQGQLDGFYIEVGAYDGRTFSVSYAFDCIGWNGLLIEPIPERYRQCAANRPDARVVHAALGPHAQPPTVRFTVTEDDFEGMLSSVSGQHHMPNLVRSSRVVEVPYTTMDALLADHNGEIDFASVDVEGHEVPLLRGFNLDRFRPKVLLIECDPSDKALAPYLMGWDYMPIGRQAFNAVFARADLAKEFAVRLHGPGVFA